MQNGSVTYRADLSALRGESEGAMKQYVVIFRSRYYPLEGDRRKKLRAASKKWIRDNWHCIIDTDEYRIVRIEEVKAI